MQDPTSHIARALTRNYNKRQLQISLLLLAVSTLTLLRTSNGSFSFRSSSLSRPLALPPTLVGPRPVTAPDGLPLYDSCSTEEFLDAVKRATVREDGKIKSIDYAKEIVDIELPPVEYSFDFPADSKCKAPKIYSQEEACELLGAYGGCVFPFLKSFSPSLTLLSSLVVSTSSATPSLVISSRLFTSSFAAVSTAVWSTIFDDRLSRRVHVRSLPVQPPRSFPASFLD